MVPSQLLPSDPFFLSYLAVFAAAALACLAGAGRARQVESPDVRRGLIGLLGTSGLWASAHVGMLLAPGLQGKTAFYEAGLIVGFATVGAWLWLCCAYSGRALHQSRLARGIALLLFGAVTLTKLTNPWHGLYFSAGWDGIPFRHLRVDHHSVYWITAGLSYMGAAVGFFMLAEPLRRIRAGGWGLAGLFGLAALPLGANAIGYASPYLLNLSHEPIGVAAFAIGVLFVQENRFEEAARAGTRGKPVLLLSEEGRLRNYNRPAAVLFAALEEEGALGTDLAALLPEVAEAIGDEPAPTGGAETFQVEEDGAARYYRPTESTFRQGGGRQVAFADVTERALRRREREARMQGVTDSIPGVVFQSVARPDGTRRFRHVSQRAETLLGLSAEPEGFQERLLGQVPAPHREALRETAEEAARAGSAWRQEVPFEKPGGERIWLLVSATPEDERPLDEGEVAFNGVLLDITERAEERRRRKQTIRRTTDGIVEVGPDWRFTLVNEQAERLYGTARDDLLGERLWETFPKLEGTRFEEVYREVMQTREPARIEEHYRGLGGWFDVQVYPNEDGGLAFYFEEITGRKEAEEELRQQKALLEQTQKLAGAWEVDLRAGEVAWSSEMYQIYELPPGAEMTLEKSFSFYPPEGREKLQSAFQRCAQSGEPYDVEVPLVTDKGNRRWVRAVGAPTEKESGEVVKVAGALQDITGRKESRRQLERYREYTGRLLNGIDDLFFVFDGETRLRRWNGRVPEVTGYSEATLEEMNALGFVPAGERERVAAQIADGFMTGHAQMEIPLLREDGTTVPYEVVGNLVKHPEDGLRVVGIGRDISERKAREERLERRRQMVESLYDATGRLLRAESREAVSDRIHEVVGEVFDYPLAHTGFVDEKLMMPERTEAAAGFTLPGPEPRPVEGDTVAARALQAGEAVVAQRTEALENPLDYGDLRSAAGVPIGKRGAIVVGTAEEGGFDPTDLRLLEVLGSYAALVLGRLERERELLQAKEEAEEANRVKSVFLANMSHEIRTPLTSILGFAEAIGEEVRVADERASDVGSGVDLPTLQEFAGLIEKSGARLMETLTGVLNLSKLEAGEMDLDLGPVDLSAEAAQIAEELRPQAEERGLGFRVEAGAPAWARADAGGMQIVLRNLVSNAIKYTEEGAVQVRAYQERGEAVLEVEDSGIGMDPGRVETLFEPFRQASEGRNRAYEGTGLGLAVTRKTARQMGGRLEVETEEGVGTCVTVRLPRAEDAEKTRDVKETSSGKA